VILESLFASPLLTLFANLIPVEQATRVLERFMLVKNLFIHLIDGEKAILDIMKYLLRKHETEIT